jgi:hypothetical protein
MRIYASERTRLPRGFSWECRIRGRRASATGHARTGASKLGCTKKHLQLVVVGTVTLILLTSSVVVAIVETSSSCVGGKQFLCPDSFSPAPKLLLTDGEIEFNRLGTSNLSRVRITPARADRIAGASYGRERDSRIVFESLGGYIDKNQIVHDWVGTKSWIPKAIPSYLVRIHSSQLVTLDPSSAHYWNIIVNALNGKIIVAFTYD